VVIVCEGETERQILTQLRQHWRVASARVEIVGSVGDPKRIVEEAKRKAKEFYRGDRPIVVVVFDRDSHTRWAEALDQARALGFVVAVSNPCVELWGLLLHRDHTASIEPAAAQAALAQVHPRYHHRRHPYFDLGVVLEGLAAARARAELLAKLAREGQDPWRNPTTWFGLAVDALHPRPVEGWDSGGAVEHSPRGGNSRPRG